MANVASRSTLILAEQDRRMEILERIAALAPSERFDLPYICVTWRSDRDGSESHLTASPSSGQAGSTMGKEARLLGDRDFRLVAGSVGLSAFGDWVAIVALGLQIKGMTGAGLEVAALWICLFGPSVALAAHAGLLVDRMETTRLLALVSAAGAVLAAATGLLGGTSLAALLGLTVLLGAIFAVSQPAEFALVPLLAGRDRAQEANGHVETARYIGFGLGPLVGGIAFAAGGLGLAMAIDALTFACVAIAATRLRVRREPGAAARPRPPPPARASPRCLTTASCAW